MKILPRTPSIISRLSLLMTVGIILVLGRLRVAHGAEFFCQSGNVTCLIAAITKANGLPGEHTIKLQPGIYRLIKINNSIPGDARGLPRVTGMLTIRGTEPARTVIERQANAADFGIVYVTAKGRLTLDGVTIRQGTIVWGGGIRNAGKLTVSHSIVSDTVRGGFGAGLFNEKTGTIIIADSTVKNNFSRLSAGGLYNGGGVVRISNSAFTSNTGSSGAGGLFNDHGKITVLNSTFADNRSGTVGGAIANISEGELTIRNSTISHNAGGISNSFVGAGPFGKVELQNTILANNAARAERDCSGSIITSLGKNRIGDLSRCTINLQRSDRVGAP